MRAAALLVVLAVAAATVGAEHVYSHRYLVVGRLLDEAGRPVEGRAVGVAARGMTPWLCEETPGMSVHTDAWGDFRLCLHSHDLAADASIALKVEGAAVFTADADRDLRTTAFLLALPNATGVEPPGWSRSYAVDGKVWERTRPATLEGVPVTGVALADEPVSVRLVANGTAYVADVRTDDYGEYATTFRLPHDVADGVLNVTVRNATKELPLSAFHHRSRVNVVVEDELTYFHPGLDTLDRLDPGNVAAWPEAQTAGHEPALGLSRGVLLAIVAIGAGAWVAVALLRRRGGAS